MNLQQSSTTDKHFIQEFIEKELNLSAPELSSEARKKLTSIAFGFFENQISMTAALTVFAECSCPATVVTKLAHIKASGYQPIPLCKDNLKTSLMPTRKKSAVWKADEDMRLLTAISRYGPRDWVMIAAFVGGGRTSSQCNQRWTRALDPSISREPWSAEEDQQLIKIVNQMGECGWRRIASQLDGRTDLQCRHRYLQLKRISNKLIQNNNQDLKSHTTTKQGPHEPLPSLLLEASNSDPSLPLSLASIPLRIDSFGTTMELPHHAISPTLIVKRGNLTLQ